MYRTTFLALLALTTTSLAQLSLPACANTCYANALTASTCDAADYVCQCTTGQQAIQDSAIPCLCHSDCQTSDLIAVVQDTNSACGAALSAVNSVYQPFTVGLGVCATASSASGSSATATGTGSSGMANGTASGSQASATGTAAGASGSGSGRATASAAQQTASSSGAGAMVGYGREALLGLAGLAALAL